MSPRTAKPSKRSSTKQTSRSPVATRSTAGRRATAKQSPQRGSSSKGAPRKGGVRKTSSGKGARPGTERARDEMRSGGGPRFAGGPWNVADERGNQRFGRARNEDADPSELAPQDAEIEDDDRPTVADPELAAAEASGEIESGGRRTGMRRGEQPHRNRER